MMKFFKPFCAALVGALLSFSAAAQGAYPNKSIRIIVPFPPGGGSDLVARTVSARLSEHWKVPVVVDNKPGGNTIIAAEAAAKAPADGYTLFVVIDSTLAMNQSLYAKLPYDPIKSFAPITLAVSQPMVLAVNPKFEAHSVAELLAMAKAQPGKLAYAFGAMPAQVAGEAFKAATQADLLPVAYKGSAPAMLDTVAGQVPIIFDALGPAMSYVSSGKVRALAVTSGARNALLPDVPTLAESGATGVDLETWIGFVAPAGVDKAIITKLHEELTRILRMPETQKTFSSVGMGVVASTPAQFSQTIQSDTEKFGRIIKAAGIKLD